MDYFEDVKDASALGRLIFEIQFSKEKIPLI